MLMGTDLKRKYSGNRNLVVATAIALVICVVAGEVSRRGASVGLTAAADGGQASGSGQNSRGWLAGKGSVGGSNEGGDKCGWIEKIGSKEKKIVSQGGQDGIIEYIFGQIGVTNKYFVEFGFGYASDQAVDNASFYSMGLNTGLLFRSGWKGVYFDALVESKEYGVVKSTLTEENIVDEFVKHGVLREMDYLSIDVDSADLWLLRSIMDPSSPFRPRVMSVEFNTNFSPDMMVSMEPRWHAWTGRSVYGASAGALNYVAGLAGYSVVYIMPNGLDMFFIRNDILGSCGDQDRFGKLAGQVMPARKHPPCDATDLSRLVDVYSFLQTQRNFNYSNRKAKAEVQRLKEDWGIHMCDT
eukprot:jgi/Picsp_1/2187/NSC_05651-R1_hypothetical protein SNE_A16770 [Simkania negevensis Z]